MGGVGGGGEGIEIERGRLNERAVFCFFLRF